MKKNAIILAAGKGTRMQSKLYKVLHEVCGKPMVDHVLTQVEKTNPDNIVTIVGHGAQKVHDYLGQRSQYALQAEQLGTGHAVLQAETLLKEQDGLTLVVSGDTPLLTAETFDRLFAYHHDKGAKATILTANAPDPNGYGRIIRDEIGIVNKIVEQKDANEQEIAVHEINTGVYCFDNQALFKALHQVGNQNAQGEYYLPDVIEILKKQGEVIAAYKMADFDESMGVNDRIALSDATKLMQQRINQKHMRQGVTLVDPLNTYIEADVKIGADTIVEANVVIKGQTIIGEDCFIGAHSTIIDSQIENNVTVTSSTIETSKMAQGSNIGPNSHLRPNAEIGEQVHIGNFCEIKNAKIGKNTKIGHLSYVGDATLGEEINVGCGVVFVNYDGVNKHHATVGDHVFLGSNSNIVAPVTIADHSFVAAGSTITQDVPTKALALGRARQVNKLDYWDKLDVSKDNQWQ